MKLLFSEARLHYRHYVFPYAVWAFPEPGETASDLLNHGFLPSSRDLDRFYLARHVRIALRRFKVSSENRRILRKGKGIEGTLVPRSEFQFTVSRREFYKDYADKKFGKDVMSYERLEALFEGKITSHLLVFSDAASGAEVGTVTLFLEPPTLAYYYYAFYDLNYYRRNLGMYMMTSAVRLFADRGFNFVYLGSCYLENALYKTQFTGAEFFNGVRWSTNLDELKYLVRRDQQEQPQHLLECEEYRRKFYRAGLGELAAASAFRIGVRR